jgi:hypothetical protein
MRTRVQRLTDRGPFSVVSANSFFAMRLAHDFLAWTQLGQQDIIVNGGRKVGRPKGVTLIAERTKAKVARENLVPSVKQIGLHLEFVLEIELCCALLCLAFGVKRKNERIAAVGALAGYQTDTAALQLSPLLGASCSNQLTRFPIQHIRVDFQWHQPHSSCQDLILNH